MNTTRQLPTDVLYAKDLIHLYRGLERDVCRAIVERFDGDGRKQHGKVGRLGSVGQDQQTKESWDLEILDQGDWQGIFQQIHPPIQACFADYLGHSPVLNAFQLQGTGYKIQMYPKGEGYFRWHADSVDRNSRDRVAAMVLYLNDVEQGGETEFFHQAVKISPRAGNLLLFPAGWNYMHCGHVPQSADKYVISTFIKIKD